MPVNGLETPGNGCDGGGAGVGRVVAGDKVPAFAGRTIAAPAVVPRTAVVTTPDTLDLELLSAAAAGGDREAFRSIVEATEGRLYSLAYHLLVDAAEANDAVQEAYLRAFLNLGRFQPRGAGTCLAWLRRITLNVCRDWLRTKRPAPVDDLEPYVSQAGGVGGVVGVGGPASSWPAAAADPAEALALDEEDVRQAVRALPLMYREVVVLRYGHDLSYSEIARTLGEGENTVATRLRRALLMLRKSLAERGEGA